MTWDQGAKVCSLPAPGYSYHPGRSPPTVLLLDLLREGELLTSQEVLVGRNPEIRLCIWRGLWFRFVLVPCSSPVNL